MSSLLDLGNNFPLLNARATNDWNREGTLLLEFVEFAVTLSTNTGDAEVPTTLDEVLGIINLCYVDTFASGDILADMTTDGVITTGAVTVRVTCASIADGAHTFRGLLIGKKVAEAITVSNLT